MRNWTIQLILLMLMIGVAPVAWGQPSPISSLNASVSISRAVVGSISPGLHPTF